MNQLLEYKINFEYGDGGPSEKAIKEADVVISQGGGYMIGDSMQPYLKSMQLAQNLGKPTYFYPNLCWSY